MGYIVLLPHEVLGFGVEAEGLGPSGLLAGGLDEVMNLRGDGAASSVVLIVNGAAERANQPVFNLTHGVLGHVEVELLHAYGHRHGLIVTEIFAGAVGSFLVSRIDAGDNVLLRVGILPHLIAQALVVAWALVTEAAHICLCFLLEKRFLVGHISVISYFAANVQNNRDVTK